MNTLQKGSLLCQLSRTFVGFRVKVENRLRNELLATGLLWVENEQN
jgi:hypothetical protein